MASTECKCRWGPCESFDGMLSCRGCHGDDENFCDCPCGGVTQCPGCGECLPDDEPIDVDDGVDDGLE